MGKQNYSKTVGTELKTVLLLVANLVKESSKLSERNFFSFR